MKVILVPISNRPESRTALQVAAELTNLLDANVVACHLRPHRMLEKDYKPRGGPLLSLSNKKWQDDLMSKDTKSAARETKKLFEEISTTFGFKQVARLTRNSLTASWQERVGSPDKLLGILGPVADLVVLSRPAANAGVARMFLLAALMHSGRPVLLMPPKQYKAPGKHIAIAWNQSAEVSRLTTACLPLLKNAERVTIISCGPESHPGPKATQLKGYLRTWGVEAKVVKTPGKAVEEEILQAYKNTKSDLLLMGAYSRTRFREIIFGGTTEYMLWKTQIPLILQHSS